MSRVVVLGVAALALIAAFWRSASFMETAVADRSVDARDQDVPTLEDACQKTAAWVRNRMPPGEETIVRPPFVLGGDLSPKELDACHEQIVAPLTRALASEYFAASPTEPIAILLFNSFERYQHCAREWCPGEQISSFGCYRPHLRTLLVNLGRGASGLRHELTHALMAWDFPDAPAWLSEGLASLHEDAHFAPQSNRWESETNWRLPVLQAALQRGELRPIPEFLLDRDFHGPRQRLNYAHARYLCLYLQARGVLREVYSGCRQNSSEDRDGAKTLTSVFRGESEAEFEASFRGWVTRLRLPAASQARRGTKFRDKPRLSDDK